MDWPGPGTAPSRTRHTRAFRGNEQELRARNGGGEVAALLGGQDAEGGGERAGIHGLSRDHSRAQDVARRLPGTWIHDVGVVPALNVEAAPVAAAGRDRAIAHHQTLHGRAILGVGARVGKVHGLCPRSANHQVAADIENGGPDAGNPERHIDGPSHDVALHE